VSFTFKPLLAFRASVYRVDQNTVKIVNMEIDVNRRPVPLISSNIARTLRREGSCSFLNQPDLGAATFEDDIRSNRSSDFDETQCVTIKSQPLIELRDVNCHRVVHIQLFALSIARRPKARHGTRAYTPTVADILARSIWYFPHGGCQRASASDQNVPSSIRIIAGLFGFLTFTHDLQRTER
jgi:hypothetical protein